MGIAIQAAVEDLYNEELWRHDGLPRRLSQIARIALKKELSDTKRNWIDWKFAGMGEADMEEIVVNGVLGYLKTMKAHRLLGPYARAEKKLSGWIDKYNEVAGIADTIIRREDTGITILDGKNSKTKLEYVDPDQLRYYALCFFLAYDKMPDRLAFVWYRYPYDKETGEQGLDWVEFTERDLQGLAARARDARKGMNKEMFSATPSTKACQYCDYKDVCPERVAIDTANAEKRKDKLPIVGHADGFVEFDLHSDGQTVPDKGKGE